MRNKAAASFLTALWMICFSVLAAAETGPVKWNDAKDHNRWTEQMLFGNPSYRSFKPEEIRQRVERLEDALLICLDQFNGSYKDKLAGISFIDGVPEDIGKIDFVAGTDHRAFTHRGWNHAYAQFEIEKSHPDIRKQILVSVVEHVFAFEKNSADEQAEEQADAMGCMLYNMHIIEDRYHSKTYSGALSTLLLADAGAQTESVTHDLLACIPILFPAQKKGNDTDYRELIAGIQRISDSVVSGRRKADTRDAYLEIDRKYAMEIRDLLAEHLPDLLRKQPWFTEAFPLYWNSD